MAGSLVLLTLLVAVTFTELSSKLITIQLTYQGQALNVANAGLIDGAGWFLRQSTQPVATFNPQHNLSLTPPVDDTDVNTTPMSIQRDFEISQPSKVWGHYEMTAGSIGAGGTVATGVYDLTQSRRGSAAGSGIVWQLESTGYVYVQNDGSKAYNQSPNSILAKRTLRSEISRFAVVAPNAAVSIQNCSSATVGTTGLTNARVVGGANGAGIACISGTGSVSAQRCLAPERHSAECHRPDDRELQHVEHLRPQLDRGVRGDRRRQRNVGRGDAGVAPPHANDPHQRGLGNRGDVQCHEAAFGQRHSRGHRQPDS